MSKYFILNSICIMLVGTFVGYGVTHLVIKNNRSNSLEMASIAPIENRRTLTKLASQQIYQDYFDVRIKHDSISKNAEGQSIVKAIVTAKKDLPAGLNYQWKLGEGVTSSSPHMNGQLGAIKNGEKQEISLSVYGFTKLSKKYLSFAIFGKIDQHDLHKENLSSSRPEDSFEYIVQQNFEYEQQRASEAAKKTNGKVSAESLRSKRFSPENIVK